MQQGDRMQLNRLKMAIQYRQKKVSREWKSLKHASIINFVLSSMTILRFLSSYLFPMRLCAVCSLYFSLHGLCLCLDVWFCQQMNQSGR